VALLRCSAENHRANSPSRIRVCHDDKLTVPSCLPSQFPPVTHSCCVGLTVRWIFGRFESRHVRLSVHFLSHASDAPSACTLRLPIPFRPG
jgi:hypothetical protein